jgi:SAM-dependent methyltransferase
MTRKVLINTPSLPARAWPQKIIFAGASLFLAPIYWALAAFKYKVPGLQFRGQCFKLGVRLLLHKQTPDSYSVIFHLLFAPMDSTRYFEFDFAARVLKNQINCRYLDVSSPRLLPVIVTLNSAGMRTVLINPDKNDLAASARLVRMAGLADRCTLRDDLIAQVPFDPETFDVVTCISVLEHIPDDLQAVTKIWSLIKPGGKLVITIPCAAQTWEQYIDVNEYGVLQPDEHGYVFFQRFYDSGLLNERIYSVTGQPTRSAIYGELKAGTFFKNATRKRSDLLYPMWREPYMMGQEYGFFTTIAELPGEGVIALEFTKH